MHGNSSAIMKRRHLNDVARRLNLKFDATPLTQDLFGPTLYQFTSEVCQFQDQHSKRCRGFLIEAYSSKLQSSRSSQILFSIFLDCPGGRLRKSLSTCLHIRFDPIPFLQSSQLCLRTFPARSTSM